MKPARTRPPRVAAGLNNLAGLYQDMGDTRDAEPLYLRSLKIRAGQAGTRSPRCGGGPR